MTDLASLLARVKEAKGPDRELDEALAYLDGWEYHGPRPSNKWAGHWVNETQPNFGSYSEATQLCDCTKAYDHEPPPYTASLDAVLAMCGRVLPGWRKGFREHDGTEGDGWYAWACSPDYSVIQWTAGDVTKTDVTAGIRATGDAPTPALALLAALLTAMEQKP